MPIRFRCSYCNRLLGIATRKAGMETLCPHCGYAITVPMPPEAEERTARVSEEEGRTERVNLDDVEEMLGNTAVEPAPAAAVAAVPVAPPAQHGPEGALPPMAAPITLPPPPVPKVTRPPVVPKGFVEPTVPVAQKAPSAPKPPPKAPASNDPNERPLFEGDMDEILGATKPPEEPDREKKPAVSGMDAMSLGEPARNIVVSAQKATYLMILFVVLLVGAFAAGYFLAPKG